jgi:hypothetical protein
MPIMAGVFAPRTVGSSTQHARAWASAVRDWAARNRLVLAVGFLAALPVVVAMGFAVRDHWAPLGDDAYIGIRAYDVFTSRMPLVGQRSSGASGILSQTAYSPGPLLFWLLALPARLPDSIFLTLTTGAVNVASIMGTVGLALRRGGRTLMFATAVAIPVMLASLPAETYSDIWNSSAPLMPLMLLVFLAWSVACGEYRLLPLTLVVASFATQAHLTFVAPALGVTGVAILCAALFGTLRHWPRRWVLGSLATLLVCWSAPLLDQLIHRPGNFVLLVRSASSGDASAGFSAGWHAVVRMVGVPPWWLRDDRSPLERIGDLIARPGALAIATAFLVLVGLAAAVVTGWRRRRADLCAAGLLGLALCVAVGLGASSTPVKSFGTVGYTLRWTSPTGMSVWLLLGWSVATMVPVRQLARWRVRATAPALATLAVVTAVVAVAENPPRTQPYKVMRAIFGRLEAEVPPTGGTRVEASNTPESLALAPQFEVGIVYWLRHAGRSVVTPPDVAERLNGDYARGSYVRTLHVATDVAPRGGRQLFRLPFADPLRPNIGHVVTVTEQRRPESAN